MKVRFVTGNEGKVREASQHLGLLGVTVVGVGRRVVEIQADTLEEIAVAKAEALRGQVPTPYFVEDAGLFIEALKGFPGAYSAYVFKTVGCEGLLRLLKAAETRGAVFRAVVALVEGPGRPRLFTGECRGRIVRREHGDGGFGFDPVFVPNGERRTFAEMAPAEKSALSHRGRALDLLSAFLGRPA